jgi:hypothetical protein
MYYEAPAGAPSEAYVYQEGIDPQVVELDKRNFSKSFDMGDGSIRMAFLPTLLAEDAEVPESAPSVAVPEDWTKVLILVFQDTSNTVMPIRLQAINTSDDVFVPGGILIANFSEITVFGKVGDKKLVSKPKSVEFIKQPISERGHYAVSLYTYKDGAEKRSPLLKQRWQYNPGTRVITFITPAPLPRMVKLYSAPIPDF